MTIARDDKHAALILCACGLWGVGGLHYFYTRRYGKGILHLLTCGLFFIGTIIDIVKIIKDDFCDADGVFLTDYSDNAPDDAIYKKPLFIIAALIICYPVGLFLSLKSNLSKTAKYASGGLSAVLACCLILWLSAYGPAPKYTDQVIEITANELAQRALNGESIDRTATYIVTGNARKLFALSNSFKYSTDVDTGSPVLGDVEIDFEMSRKTRQIEPDIIHENDIITIQAHFESYNKSIGDVKMKDAVIVNATDLSLDNATPEPTIEPMPTSEPTLKPTEGPTSEPTSIPTDLPTPVPPIQTAQTEEQYVYIGETGTKYHRSDCMSLGGRKYKITLERALKEGREPCKICEP